jgi:hypothetical protein
LITTFLLTGSSIKGMAVQDGDPDRIVYLPLVIRGKTETPKMLGVVPQGYWGTTTNDVQNKLKALDQWAGKKHTIVGWFYDIVNESDTQNRTDVNFKGQLENLWVNGYVSFVNLGAAGASANQIANGTYDTNLHNLARSYAAFVNMGGGRKAFIAPLQEMNGYWVSYGNDPSGFKAAYANIQKIFAEHGIDRSEIWWTFAPNGWSESWNGFELYYPGDGKVDVVSYSSYNYGYCPVGNPEWRKWDDYTVVHKPYIDRMRQMAPNKPIIIAQTATSAQYPYDGNYDSTKKNTWLVDTYNYLAKEPNLAAILYFDMNKEAVGECDYEVYNGLRIYDGYKTAVSNSKFTYYDPTTLSTMNLLGNP